MKRFFTVSAYCIAVLFAGAFSAHAERFFPLHAGESCTYRAQIKWTLPNSSEVRSDTIQWRTHVEKVIDMPGVRIGIVRGLPMQLAWHEPGKSPRLDVVAERADGLWIADASSELDANALAERFAKGETPGEQLFKFPVKIGDCIAGDSPPRSDRLYCWGLEEAAATSSGKAWRITYRSLPDYQEIEFLPGIGIKRYVYLHHGTVAEASAVLQNHAIEGP